MGKKNKKQKVAKAQPEVGSERSRRVKLTRNELMLQAKERGIKNFRVLNKEELGQVLAEGATLEQIEKIVSGSVARWRSGWGSRKKQ